MRVSNVIVSLNEVPADRIVHLPKHRHCRALQCPMTFAYKLTIDGEDVDGWFEQQNISEEEWILVRNYDRGLWHDHPVIQFQHKEHAVLFLLRWS